MELKEAIEKRRSIRHFAEGKIIDKEIIKDVLRSAMYAPSAVNKKPWRFIVVEDREIMDKLNEAHNHAHFLAEASCAIIVCGDVNESYKSFGNDYWQIDCSAATQNMLLAIHDKGLGACWCGLAPSEDKIKKFQEILGLPEHIKPFSLNAVGYPKGDIKQPKDRYDEAKVTWK